MNVSEMQVIVNEMVAAVTSATTVESSATTLLNTLGAFFIEHKDDPAAIEAMGTAMTNSRGSLNSSATSLAAAITANTPATGGGTGNEVNTCNQAGQDAGVCTLGEVIANDNPDLAAWKNKGYVDTANASPNSPNAARRR